MRYKGLEQKGKKKIEEEEEDERRYSIVVEERVWERFMRSPECEGMVGGGWIGGKERRREMEDVERRIEV